MGGTSHTVRLLAENLNRLMDERQLANRRLALSCGLGEGTIQRIRRAQVAIQIDTLERLANYFGLEPWQLLTSRMDPVHPPATFPTAEEQALYEKFKALARQFRPDQSAS